MPNENRKLRLFTLLLLARAALEVRRVEGAVTREPIVSHGSKTVLTREGKKKLRGLQPVSAWQAEAILHCVHPLPSRQAETQLRGV
jgi:hypothetical protein